MTTMRRLRLTLPLAAALSLGVGGRYYANSPPGGPECGVGVVFTILLPK